MAAGGCPRARCRRRDLGPSRAPPGVLVVAFSSGGGFPGGSPLGSRTCRTECRSRTASGRVAAGTGRGGERGAAPEGPPSSSGAARHPQKNLPKFHSSTPQGEAGWPAPGPVPTGATRELPNRAAGWGAQLPAGWGGEGGICAPSGAAGAQSQTPGTGAREAKGQQRRCQRACDSWSSPSPGSSFTKIATSHLNSPPSSPKSTPQPPRLPPPRGCDLGAVPGGTAGIGWHKRRHRLGATAQPHVCDTPGGLGCAAGSAGGVRDPPSFPQSPPGLRGSVRSP